MSLDDRAVSLFAINTAFHTYDCQLLHRALFLSLIFLGGADSMNIMSESWPYMQSDILKIEVFETNLYNNPN